ARAALAREFVLDGRDPGPGSGSAACRAAACRRCRPVRHGLRFRTARLLLLRGRARGDRCGDPHAWSARSPRDRGTSQSRNGLRVMPARDPGSARRVRYAARRAFDLTASFAKNSPASYSRYIGTAMMIIEIESGGASAAAAMVIATSTYPRFEAIFSTLTRPVVASSTTAIGASKAMPNARNSRITKSRYCEMSVIIRMPFGVVATMNWNTTGKTAKNANAMPA